MDTVYIETTVIGHLAGRLHSNAAIATRQQLTRGWWAEAQSQFRFLISQIVLDECAAGDPIAARERLEIADSLPLLDITEAIRQLADELMARGAIPVIRATRLASRCDFGSLRSKLLDDLELQAHRECDHARSYRGGVP